MNFLARNYHALSHKYALGTELFQNAGFDMEAAMVMHSEVQVPDTACLLAARVYD